MSAMSRAHHQGQRVACSPHPAEGSRRRGQLRQPVAPSSKLPSANPQPRFEWWTAGSRRRGLARGLSRMRGNSHVRFLGGSGAAMRRSYPTARTGPTGTAPGPRRSRRTARPGRLPPWQTAPTISGRIPSRSDPCLSSSLPTQAAASETVKVSAFHSLRGTVPFSCNRAGVRPSEHYGSADAKESRSRANAAKPCSMTGKHGSQSNITH